MQKKIKRRCTMNLSFQSKTMLVCLVLCLAVFGVLAQEYSLDDNPSAPFGPFRPPFCSAEDEFGIGLPANAAGMVGPSPSQWIWGFFDSDVLGIGPVLVMTFPPAPFYVDSFSADHSQAFFPSQVVRWRFSVDRATGGLNAGCATWQQALNNEQPGDIYDSFLGGNNFLAFDQRFFGLIPAGPPPCPPIVPGSHDNIDGYNDTPGPMMNFRTFFTLHPASASVLGFSPADIFICFPGGLVWPTPVFAPAGQMGLIPGVPIPGGVPVDSIDALVVWDYGIQGICDPGRDYAMFSLAPGSPSLGMGGWDGGTIFATTFNGAFWVVANSWQLGLGPWPVPPLLGNQQDVNVDALEVSNQ
jgi:hypothetical protein